MSFMEHPQSDACRALMPTPEPHPPGPPSRPMVCHMPKGHDGPHALTRRPGLLDRRWEGDARPMTASTPKRGTRVTAVELVDPGEPQSVEIADDYVLIVDGTAYMAGVQVHANGTHVITVKGVRR